MLLFVQINPSKADSDYTFTSKLSTSGNSIITVNVVNASTDVLLFTQHMLKHSNKMVHHSANPLTGICCVCVYFVLYKHNIITICCSEKTKYLRLYFAYNGAYSAITRLIFHITSQLTWLLCRCFGDK